MDYRSIKISLETKFESITTEIRKHEQEIKDIEKKIGELVDEQKRMQGEYRMINFFIEEEEKAAAEAMPETIDLEVVQDVAETELKAVK